jgi:hypothetical protein
LATWKELSIVNLFPNVFRTNKTTRPRGAILQALQAEVVFIIYHYPNHWGAVNIREQNKLHMVIADGLLMKDHAILDIYANYFHYLAIYTPGQQYNHTNVIHHIML